jgi:diguanylate cyclase (GGDEF)-like protein
VIPIGVIVAVAIVCVVVAVLSSAQRADEVALEQEKRLFIKSLADHGERILRELESVATTEQAVQRIRLRFDRAWVQTQIGLWLRTFFDHDFVFVSDGSGQLTYALLGRESVTPSWLNTVLPELMPTLKYMRDPAGAPPSVGMRLTAPADLHAPVQRTAILQTVLGRPAIVASVFVLSSDEADIAAEARSAPIATSIRFIDEDVLAEIAARLQLHHLRNLPGGPIPLDDYEFDLTDPDGRTVARFAWTPKRPGAEIVRSVIPFIAVALAGFTLLSGLIFKYIRRTAAMIASGEKRMRYLALHDPLCGLPNRNYFGDSLEETIEEVRKGGPPAAIFYIDLDHFKDVNDILGHPVGDELIRNVTARLKQTARQDDLVARLGGDEFAILTTITPDNELLDELGKRFIASLCAPYSINGHMITIGASIGIAVIGRRSGTAADLMRYADIALYRAKNEGRNRACIYDAAMDADLSLRKQLERDLREAIENDTLHLAYQPIVNASGETMIAVEALARWIHPERGEIPPSEFIPIAEQSGLIIELGDWVLRRACRDSKNWTDISLAVNVSPLQFRRSDFAEVVQRIIEETGFESERLEIELTESTLLGNVEAAQGAMQRLKMLGVRLALDDFGTGYSSLAYLRRFPFDKLKIDRSFVRSIEKAADAAAIVHAIVSLGRGLGMKVTAEGVETAEQQLFLRAAGVHSMQGYRFGRPADAADITARLAKDARDQSAHAEIATAIAS